MCKLQLEQQIHKSLLTLGIGNYNKHHESAVLFALTITKL